MKAETPQPNPFYERQSRHVRQCIKEARLVACVVVVALVYTTIVVVWLGYPQERPSPPPLVLGIPSWVCWGVLLPWLVLIGITWWFAVCFLKDDEPHSDRSEGDAAAARDSSD